MDEALHSCWLEKVRKDVECSFGSLKARFRCLKLPMRFSGSKGRDTIDAIFITCAILHNMLLDDELEQREQALDGGLDADRDETDRDVIFRHMDETHQRHEWRAATNDTDFSSTGDRGACDDTEQSVEVEKDASWQVLHDALVAHFKNRWDARALVWPGRK